MKQLHRQSSLSKQHRPHHRTRSLASYLLREHRLLFVLLASSFFLLYPSLAPHRSSLSSSAHAATTSAAAARNPRVFSTTANDAIAVLGVVGVRSCYDEGKRTAETLTMDYHRGAGVEVRLHLLNRGVRSCYDEGKRTAETLTMDYHRGAGVEALRKQPMTVYGDGKQTTSFQYVSDLVDGLVTLMESKHIGPFNLGNPGEFTMLELAQVVNETIDPSASVEFKPNTADDPHMRKPNISKAKSLLHWEPKVSLRQGLPLMVSDFQKRILDEK